jgi:hypothetical protein
MARVQSAPAQDLTPTKARQGEWGFDMFWVLVLSVVLAGAALAAAWIYWAPSLRASEANNSPRAALSRTIHAPESQPVQAPANTR